MSPSLWTACDRILLTLEERFAEAVPEEDGQPVENVGIAVQYPA